MAHVVKELYNDSQLILVGDNNQVGCLSRHQSGSSILNVGNGCCIFSSPSFVLKLVFISSPSFVLKLMLISVVAACYWQVATFLCCCSPSLPLWSVIQQSLPVLLLSNCVSDRDCSNR